MAERASAARGHCESRAKGVSVWNFKYLLFSFAAAHVNCSSFAAYRPCARLSFVPLGPLDLLETNGFDSLLRKEEHCGSVESS